MFYVQITSQDPNEKRIQKIVSTSGGCTAQFVVIKYAAAFCTSVRKAVFVWPRKEVVTV
jgi:hypothetical protein